MADLKTGVIQANGLNFHYLEAGEGPLALCFHGFPDHAYSFRHLLPDLAKAGFRAVAPFMRGYAPTEAPKDGRYQTGLLAKDALGLIDAMGAEKAVLIGNDWGAQAVYGATILEPERVTKMVSIAASHPATAEKTNYQYLKGIWHAFYFQLEAAEATLAHDDYVFIEDWWRDASPEWDIPKPVLDSAKETFRKPGVVKAALDYYRHSYQREFHDPALKEVQQQVETGTISVPTLAIHGTRDRPRRLEAFHAMDSYFTGRLEKVVIPGTGHFMHQERPREINPLIVQFLKE